MATQINLDAFYERLTLEYENLVDDPDYAGVFSGVTPRHLARKMTLGLDAGTANKDGKGIRRTCAYFGIDYTYKAIRRFLAEK